MVYRCPVRGCGRPLAAGERSFACAAGHSFDRARAGYVNLLQPQDRRSKSPGDSRQAALARRRLYAAGHADPLLAALLSAPELVALPAGASVLDVGCGEGWMLARLPAERGWEAHGVDISAPSIELAARLAPGASWVVANADRFLPYEDASFDFALSLTARLPRVEMRRVLRPAGCLVVAVAGPDDLAELREEIQGQSLERQRLDRAEKELAADFELSRRDSVHWQVELSPEGVRDLLASSYRGTRFSQREKAALVGARRVTMSREVGFFRLRE